MNKVEQIFIDRALNRGGIIVYSKKNALRFLESCIRNNIEVLGIDGFFIKENLIQPSLEDSIDFSSKLCSQTENVNQIAIEFVKSREDNLYFEIVCD